jgi:hypothetical protein
VGDVAQSEGQDAVEVGDTSEAGAVPIRGGLVRLVVFGAGLLLLVRAVPFELWNALLRRSPADFG